MQNCYINCSKDKWISWPVLYPWYANSRNKRPLREASVKVRLKKLDLMRIPLRKTITKARLGGATAFGDFISKIKNKYYFLLFSQSRLRMASAHPLFKRPLLILPINSPAIKKSLALRQRSLFNQISRKLSPSEVNHPKTSKIMLWEFFIFFSFWFYPHNLTKTRCAY